MQPSRKLAAVWRVRLGLLFLLLIFPLWLLAKRYPATGALSITMLTGICLMIWVLIPRYCRKLHYRLEEEGITITRGLFFARIDSPSQAGISLYVCLSDAVLPDGRAIRSCTLGRRDAYATARDDAGAGAGSFISLNQGGKGGQPVMKRMHPAYVLTQLPRFFWR